jgi:GT2 family glycosyltransferase
MTRPHITTIVLHHPARPDTCLRRTLESLSAATTKAHRVEVVVQGPLKPGVKLPVNREYKFSLEYIYKDRNVGLSLPLHESIERLQSPYWAKLDDDIAVPPDAWDMMIAAIEDERRNQQFKIGMAFIATDNIPPRLFEVVYGDTLLFRTGCHVRRHKLRMDWEVCDFSGMGATVIPKATFDAGFMPDPRYVVSGENIDFCYQLWQKNWHAVHLTRPICMHNHKGCTPPEYGRVRWDRQTITNSANLFWEKWGLVNPQLWKAAGLKPHVTKQQALKRVPKARPNRDHRP